MCPSLLVFLMGCGSVGVDVIDGSVDPGPDGGGATDTHPPLGDGGSPPTDSPTDSGRSTDTREDTGTVVDGGSADNTDSKLDTLPGGGTDTSAPDTDSDSHGPTDSGGPTDSEVDGGDEPSVCDILYSATLGCAGFENGDAWIEDVRGDDSIVEAVTEPDPVYDGNQALHVRTGDNFEFAHVTLDFTPVTEGSVYFRGYFYVPQQTFTGLVKLAALRGWDAAEETGEGAVDVNISNTGSIVVFAAGEPVDQAHFESASQPIPWDRWFCLQGAVAISDNQGNVSVSVDSTEQLFVERVDTLPPSGISLADVGIGWTEDATGPMEVYADNFVVDTSPIPCD